jgi:transposase
MDLLNNTATDLVDADGEPIAWPAAIAGDKGYRAGWIDEMFLEMGVTPVIPSKTNEDRASRKVDFDKELYRRRNIVERVIGWLKECRAVFSRFEKTAINYAGMVKIACIQRYLRLLAPAV